MGGILTVSPMGNFLPFIILHGQTVDKTSLLAAGER